MHNEPFQDEYGFAFRLQPSCPENRRDDSGRRLGLRGRDERSYDERQITPKDHGTPTDTQGQLIDGP